MFFGLFKKKERRPKDIYLGSQDIQLRKERLVNSKKINCMYIKVFTYGYIKPQVMPLTETTISSHLFKKIFLDFFNA